MKNRKPKTEWMKETRDGRIILWKSAVYSQAELIVMGVVRLEDHITPDRFLYALPDDADPNYSVQIDFYRRGEEFYYLQLFPMIQNGKAVLCLPNFVTFSDTQTTVNLFELHNLADAVMIHYMALNGEEREFRFPLAGFNEHYLGEFI